MPCSTPIHIVLHLNTQLLFLLRSPAGYSSKISQMPIILTPLHFDRDALQKQPSCRRSVVIRTFITSDFMTGIPATPGNQIPEEVSPSMDVLLAAAATGEKETAAR